MRVIVVLLFAVCALAAQDPYQRFFDEYYFRYNPTAGTSAGFHQYDSQLEDYSKATVEQRVKALHQLEREFAALPSSVDRELVMNYIRASLLELESIRQWTKNPDIYSSGITNSVFVIMSRNYAPQPERLRSVIARERQMPAVFAAARENLSNPPKIYTQIALEQLPGIISFFQNDVPLAFKQVKDPVLLGQFEKSNGDVINALHSYQSFLQDDLLPHSNGEFRIGAENYHRKLEYEEMVDTPLSQLLKIGYENLRQNQRAFQEVAKRIDPRKTPMQILDDLQKDHVGAGQLLQAFRDVLGGLRNFVIEHHIVDIPSPVMPIVEETPPFMRALTSASMDTPGPYERKATEAFLNVTLPEPNWPPQKKEELLESMNHFTVISTAIHEAFPGHYVQFLWIKQVPGEVRKLIGANTNIEGWAHYCEQMMLDEGYGGGDPKLRLGQLQDALLRNARYIVGLQMHTGKMTLDDGIQFFIKEGYQTRENAERETKRGTSDPTYLYYTLGKLEILKLREDYRKKMGAKYSLQEFHDNFMKQGTPPIKIVRQILLGESGAVL